MARSILGEIQHQTKVAAREMAKQERQAERERKAEMKRLAKEEGEAHIAEMEAKVAQLNAELSEMYSEIDSLLAATLDVDDYVDLETLRVVVEHPPFDRADLELPTPPPAPIPDPQEPQLVLPPAPTGLSGLFGKKKHAKAVTNASAAHESAVVAWKAELGQVEPAREAAASKHTEMEAQRISALEGERNRYAEECAKREADATERNKAIDMLIANLSYGAVDAVQEYVSIVLSNSVYPDHFPIEHDFEFDAATAELKLRVAVPSPGAVSTINAYSYKKSSDEITSKPVSQKTCKDRYASAVNQAALRSLHEVFEADRRGIIKTISLEVGTQTIVPATGLDSFILFVAVGAERVSFLELDLSNVVPAATLKHLGAAVSKNPFGLVAADASGIRRS